MEKTLLSWQLNKTEELKHNSHFPYNLTIIDQQLICKIQNPKEELPSYWIAETFF